MADQTTNFKITADIASYIAAMNKTQQETQKMVSGVSSTIGKVTGIFGAVAGALAGGAMFKDIIQSTVNWTGEVVKLSKVLGSSIEYASAMNVAMKHLGLESDMVSTAVLKISKTLNTNEDSFRRLGVATRDQNGNYRASADIMLDVNTKLSAMKAGTDRNIAAMQIYGRSWGELQAILKLSREELDAARDKAERLNLKVGADGAAEVRKYREAMNDLCLAGTAVKYNMGKELIPVLTQLAVWFSDSGVSAIASFTKELRDSIKVLSEWGIVAAAEIKKAKINLTSPSFGDKVKGSAKLSMINAAASAVPGSGPLLSYAAGKWFNPKPGDTIASIEANKQKDLERLAKTMGSNVSARTNGMDDDTANRLKAQVEEAERISKHIKSINDKRGKDELQLIDQQAGEWRAAGAEEVEIAKWVAGEKEKVIHDSMKKLFRQYDDDNIKRYEAEVQREKEAQEQITKAYEEGIASEKKIVEQENATRGYAASIKELSDALNPVIGKDEDLVKAESALLDGRNKLFDLQQKLRVAWLDMDKAAIDGLGKLIQLQTQYNGKIEDNVKLQEEVAVLIGKIVGFSDSAITDGNPSGAIYSDSWKPQNQYQSAAEIAKQKGGVVPTDKNAPAEYYTVNSSPGSIYDSEGKIVSKNYFGLDWRASGGPVTAYKPYIVGELGPELFVPRSSGAIVPNNQLSGKSGQTINSTVSVASLNVNLPNITQADDYDAIARGIDAALRKYQGRRI